MLSAPSLAVNLPARSQLGFPSPLIVPILAPEIGLIVHKNAFLTGLKRANFVAFWPLSGTIAACCASRRGLRALKETIGDG
jgi:hypothetical protein